MARLCTENFEAFDYKILLSPINYFREKWRDIKILNKDNENYIKNIIENYIKILKYNKIMQIKLSRYFCKFSCVIKIL